MVVKNIGNGAAFDVTVTFDPDPPYRDGKMRLSELPLFSQLKFFAPNREFRFFYKNMVGSDSGPDSPDADMVATVTYRDSIGRGYKDSIPLNPYLRWHLSQIDEKTMNDLVKAVDVIGKNVEKTASNVSELKSSLVQEVRASGNVHPGDRDALIAKLRDIRAYWNTLFAPDLKEDNIYHSPSKYQVVLARFSMELIRMSSFWQPLANDRFQEVNPEFLSGITEELFDLSAFRFYADGGASVARFQERGDKLAENIGRALA